MLNKFIVKADKGSKMTKKEFVNKIRTHYPEAFGMHYYLN